jgi:hypothetical protein
MTSWHRIRTSIEQETEDLGCEDAFEYVKGLFKQNVRKDVKPDNLILLVGYIEEQFFDCQAEFDWVYAMSYVVKRGTYQAFKRFLREYENEQLLYPVILETADEKGRLKTVVGWLDELGLAEEALGTYQWYVRDVLQRPTKRSERIVAYLETII